MPAQYIANSAPQLKVGGRSWRKNHARIRTVHVPSSRGKSFVRLVAERQEQATPVIVPIRDVAASVSRSGTYMSSQTTA
jgi:hypothetical protein